MMGGPGGPEGHMGGGGGYGPRGGFGGGFGGRGGFGGGRGGFGGGGGFRGGKWPEEKIFINLESLRNFNVRAKVVGPAVRPFSLPLLNALSLHVMLIGSTPLGLDI
jgi:hypothetical protein